MTFDKRSELNILINLAASDNKVEAKEARLIHSIAKANGIPMEEVEEMMKTPKAINSVEGMTQEEKFEHLYYLIQLMKMDGQVFRSEIVFCEHVAEKLGFKEGVVRELSAHIYSDPSITSDRDMLWKKATKFFK